MAGGNNYPQINWREPDDNELIRQMNEVIEALKKNENDDRIINSLLSYRGGFKAPIRIFGKDGNHRCSPQVVSGWLSILTTIASLEKVSGGSIAGSFPKSCGGCMVYSILMMVGCFHSSENIRLAFDFFRHVLADSIGELLELDEVNKLSLLVAENMPIRSEPNVFTRAVCLVLHEYKNGYEDTRKKMILEKLCHLIEGLGVLCTSKTFEQQMTTNRTAAVSWVKESVMNNTFSMEFASKKLSSMSQKLMS